MFEWEPVSRFRLSIHALQVKALREIPYRSDTFCVGAHGTSTEDTNHLICRSGTSASNTMAGRNASSFGVLRSERVGRAVEAGRRAGENLVAVGGDADRVLELRR